MDKWIKNKTIYTVKNEAFKKKNFDVLISF